MYFFLMLEDVDGYHWALKLQFRSVFYIYFFDSAQA
jgi:hypothetical protein